MPLYEYDCLDCGVRIEKLHGIGKVPKTCGLDCRRQGAGPFGAGVLRAVVAAPKVVTRSKVDTSAPIADAHREALRQKGLRRLGGELTEGDLDKLRDKGLTVYRKDGAKTWSRDGGDKASPATIKGPVDD